MVKLNKHSQTCPKSTRSSVDSHLLTESSFHCAIIINTEKHSDNNCLLCRKQLCTHCHRIEELFSSQEKQNFQCPHCQSVKAWRTSIACWIVNTLQMLLLFTLLPMVSFGLSIQKTEHYIRIMERKFDNLLIIVAVNLLLSIPMYAGVFFCYLFLTPIKIINAFKQQMTLRKYEIVKCIFSQQ